MKAWVRVLTVFGLLIGMLATAVPVSADTDGLVAFHVYQPYPQQYTEETIGVRVRYMDRSPWPNAAIHSVWNYRTTTSEADAYTGADGYAYLRRNISDATCGFTVRVDIFILNDTDWQQVDSQFFTPCGDSRYSSAPSYSAPSYTPPPPAYSPPSYSPPPAAVFEGPVAGSNGICPSGFLVKANVNSGIYHQPWQQYYGSTNANNCYASTSAAERDGYRASKV